MLHRYPMFLRLWTLALVTGVAWQTAAVLS